MPVARCREHLAKPGIGVDLTEDIPDPDRQIPLRKRRPRHPRGQCRNLRPRQRLHRHASIPFDNITAKDQAPQHYQRHPTTPKPPEHPKASRVQELLKRQTDGRAGVALPTDPAELTYPPATVAVHTRFGKSGTFNA